MKKVFLVAAILMLWIRPAAAETVEHKVARIRAEMRQAEIAKAEAHKLEQARAREEREKMERFERERRECYPNFPTGSSRTCCLP